MKNSTIAALVVSVFASLYIFTSFDEETIAKAFEDAGFLGLDGSEYEYQSQFDYFIAKYGRSYSENGEYENRYAIFKQNYQFIQEHNRNSEKKGFELGMNQFGDLTLKEYAELYLMKANSAKSGPSAEASMEEIASFEKSPTYQAIENLKIPENIDWRNKGVVSSVKNQGTCGAGWAFSAVAAIEGIFRLNGKSMEDLSAQQILDCTDTTEFGGMGCDGGNMTGTFLYATKDALCNDTLYPYTGGDGACKGWWKCFTSNYVAGSQIVSPTLSRLALYTAIATQPTAVYIDAANDSFRFYKSGIYSAGCNTTLNHVVTAVGYNWTPWLYFWKNNYITMKNSFGADWGIAGYFQLSSNGETGNGMCGAYMNAVYPTI